MSFTAVRRGTSTWVCDGCATVVGSGRTSCAVCELLDHVAKLKAPTNAPPTLTQMPQMLAKAWDEGYDAGLPERSVGTVRRNPYRSK